MVPEESTARINSFFLVLCLVKMSLVSSSSLCREFKLLKWAQSTPLQVQYVEVSRNFQFKEASPSTFIIATTVVIKPLYF
jgi:hypothetical protein